ncbi:MAG: MATE family efflux transporter [Xenococcaceae cyanobacterium MO_188.B29]|nr:MATE family efflux transporter [Xenococcaceae cyanobacterium MO_188.B29]
MQQRLLEGNVGEQLIKLTIPMIWGVLAITAFNIVDTYFVGQLGTKPLAAMSFTFPVVMTLGSLAMGLGVGTSSVIARAIGEGDRDRVQRLTTDSLTLSLIIVVIFVFLGLITIDPLFTALGAGADVLPWIRSYMQIWYFGMIFLVIPMVGNSAIRASGNTVTPSIIMIVAAGVNIVLDPLLIVGWGGFPRLEIEGAAIATVVSRATTLVAALLVLHYREKMLCFNLPKFQIILASWQKILQIGLPAAATSMITPISMGLITSAIAFYGAEAVAAFGVASRIESFSLIVIMALSASIGPFVGQNWGAKKYHRVHRALNLSYLFCLGWGIMVAAILAPSASWLASLFNSDPQIIQIATRYLWFVPISYAAAGIIFIASSTFNALGKPIPSMIMTVSRMVVLYIPLAYIGSQVFGINGIFAAACIANLVVGIGAYIWNQKTCDAKGATEKTAEEFI